MADTAKRSEDRSWERDHAEQVARDVSARLERAIRQAEQALRASKKARRERSAED